MLKGVTMEHRSERRLGMMYQEVYIWFQLAPAVKEIIVIFLLKGNRPYSMHLKILMKNWEHVREKFEKVRLTFLRLTQI